MLDTCLEEVGSYCCRLSDRDNAELSIGHTDTGEKGGLSLTNTLAPVPLYLLSLRFLANLDVVLCSS